jgi:hypothetical protein
MQDFLKPGCRRLSFLVESIAILQEIIDGAGQTEYAV